jgi:hypothetical protein
MKLVSFGSDHPPGLLLQIKKNNVFDSWNVLWFTCIERALNGFLDIQDACTAPKIICADLCIYYKNAHYKDVHINL